METIKLCVSFALLVLYSTPNAAVVYCFQSSTVTSCQSIKDAYPNGTVVPSGKYIAVSQSGIPIEIYCEMGLNGGSYTFLSPYALSVLTNEEISSMFTKRTSFLFRALLTNGSQPYGVLTQLSEYADIPLMLGLNNHTGYAGPVNKDILGKPYFYFGFIPIANASNNNLQGLEVNGVRVTFTNCDKNANSQMTLFANFPEVQSSDADYPGVVTGGIFSNLKPNPSGRLMSPDFFLFMETYWGGCGCYAQTNRISGVLGINIGFR